MPESTILPPYVMQGESDWRPAAERWKGPLSHPYGMGAYSVLEPGSEPPRVRVYPSRDAATPYMEECGYET